MHIHLHIHDDRQTHDLLEKVLDITINNKQKLQQMAKTLDEVLQSVTDNASVDDSIIALLAGIKKQLDDALSGASLPPAVQEKVDAIFAASEADKEKVAAAILANTPAEPNP